MASKVQVVCHKGANKLAPENTFAAARLCVEWGADYVEIDVHTSQDGVLYLFHGPYLEKTTNGSGHIVHPTSAEIDALDAGSWFSPAFAGERVPRLEAFLAWIKGKAKVYLDVKNADPHQLAGLINSLGMCEDCFFWSVNTEWMHTFHAIEPGLALKVNVKTPADAVQAREEFGAQIVEIGYKMMTPKLIDTCHRLGMRVMVVYEGKSTLAFRKILRSGVDLFNTDYGDRFLRLMEA
jgi:glycerophosphoryl diester phosphodiesterase